MRIAIKTTHKGSFLNNASNKFIKNFSSMLKVHSILGANNYPYNVSYDVKAYRVLAKILINSMIFILSEP